VAPSPNAQLNVDASALEAFVNEQLSSLHEAVKAATGGSFGGGGGGLVVHE
jgi:hypothetical protein